jgi:hypothetical protein
LGRDVHFERVDLSHRLDPLRGTILLDVGVPAIRLTISGLSTEPVLQNALISARVCQVRSRFYREAGLSHGPVRLEAVKLGYCAVIPGDAKAIGTLGVVDATRLVCQITKVACVRLTLVERETVEEQDGVGLTLRAIWDRINDDKCEGAIVVAGAKRPSSEQIHYRT